MDPAALADEVDRRIAAVERPSVEPLRRIRRDVSARAGRAGPLALVRALVGRHRWVAYEIVYHHPGALAALTVGDVERLGAGMADWGTVDAFGRYLSGPAGGWGACRTPPYGAGRPRGPVVEAGGAGVDGAAQPGRGGRDRRRAPDPRHLRAVVDDRDDMVVKALSWALRELVPRDPEAVRGFLATTTAGSRPGPAEVATKLDTGRKSRPARS